MAEIINLFPNTKPAKQVPKTGPSKTITIEQVAKGISIALLVTHDNAVTKFLLNKFNKAVNSKQYDIEFTYQEHIEYLDYIDPSNSDRYRKWADQLIDIYYGPH